MGDITLGQALDEYEKIYMAARNFAHRTRVEYSNDLIDLIQFLEQLGLRRVGEIGLPQLERYLTELDRRKIASSTRKRKVVSIRSFLWYLYQDRYISINLAKRLITPFAETKSPRYLTKPEYERLLEAASRNHRDFALIQLLLQTGIKLSELTRLTINDIELPPKMTPEMKEAGYLHIRGNNRRKGRILSLNYDACIALYTYLRKQHTTVRSALFVNRFGKQLGARGVEKSVTKYLEQAGIRNANVQSLRHTFAIHQINQDVDIEIIQSVMGYEDPRSMEKYISIVQAKMN
jgi:site-specific recombinase XerD